MEGPRLYRLAGDVRPCLMLDLGCIRELQRRMCIAESIERFEGITVSGPVISAVKVDMGSRESSVAQGL